MEPRAAGRAGGSLVLSDGPCPEPGSGGSRGAAQAGQAATPNLWEAGKVQVFREVGEVNRVGEKN